MRKLRTAKSIRSQKLIPSPFNVSQNFAQLQSEIEKKDQAQEFKISEELSYLSYLCGRVEEELARLRNIKPEKGDTGETGKDGKNIDENKVVQRVLSKIRKPQDGAPGRDGTDGHNGKDADEQKILSSLIAILPDYINRDGMIATILNSLRVPQDGAPGRDGQHAKAEEILPLFLQHLDKNPLEVKHIKGLDNFFKEMRNRIANANGEGWKMRGGGDTLAAGTGYTLVRNLDGTVSLVISSTGNQVWGETPTGSGVTFNLAHSPTAGSLRLYRGGARQQEGMGGDYTITGSVITLAITLQVGEILLADYAY